MLGLIVVLYMFINYGQLLKIDYDWICALFLYTMIDCILPLIVYI